MKKNKPQEEKRKFFRLSAYHLGKYRQILTPRQGEKILATVENISGGGVCIDLKEYLPPQTQLEIQVNFPRLTQPISCSAKIAWIQEIEKGKKYKAGIEFLDIDDTTRQAIIKSIDAVRRVR